MTSAEMKSLIETFEKSDLRELNDFEFSRAIVRDAIRDYRIVSKKSKDMAVREAELEGIGYQSWQSARELNNYEVFAPVLREILELKKKIARATQSDLTPYDANIDLFERGMTVGYSF